MKKVKIEAVALDFDYCTAYFADKEEGLIDLFVRYGVSIQDARTALDTACEQGFTIEKYISLVQESYPKLPPNTTIRMEFNRWLEHNLQLYEDSVPVIKSLHRAGIPVIFVTFGNPDFQRKKIRMLNLHHDTDSYVVEPPRAKKVIVQGLGLVHGGRILCADDKPAHLDAIRDAGLTEHDVITMRMCRPESPHHEAKSRHPHLEAKDFYDIDRFVNNS